MKYVAYGSNMSLEQMRYRCPGAQLIGTGLLHGYQLEFNHHATIVESRDSTVSVPVAVWEITPADEKHLDFYEGFPNYYRKMTCTVDMAGGEHIQGMMYQMHRFDYFPPNEGYFISIRDAYEALGLHSEIEQVLQSALMRSYHLSK